MCADLVVAQLELPQPVEPAERGRKCAGLPVTNQIPKVKQWKASERTMSLTKKLS